MSTPINLYATKVFEEHPLGLWALDEKADYVSLIPEANQDLNTWTKSGVSEVIDGGSPNYSELPDNVPFLDKNINVVVAAENNNGVIRLESPFLINPTEINRDLETFAISTYIYSFEKTINFRIGFTYTNTDNEEIETVVKGAKITPTRFWAAVAESFFLPETFSNLRIFFDLYYPETNETFKFIINGITVGQWSEEFNLSSSGVNLEDVPENIAIRQSKGLEAKSYGLPGFSGYYLAQENTLVARNSGIPLVFGSNSCTVITPNPNSPSLIVPGFGFMNRSGQYNELTAEFWIKIQSFATEPRKIFGPISSADGLYVDGPFIKIKIGNRVGAYFIREWDRPMLVHIKLLPTKAELIINSDLALELDLSPSEYSFPPKFADQKEQDWLGFYAYPDVPLIQLDCVGIYPYGVATLVAKRRFVYGQGVRPPADIKGLDSLSSIFIDYPFAKYAKNFYFPSSSSWSNGNIENLIVTDDSLRSPDYIKPFARFSDKSEDSWYTDLSLIQTEQDSYITMRPDSSWKDTEGHLSFPNMNFLQTPTRGFYGVFEAELLSFEKKVLFEITNKTTTNKIQVYYIANEVSAEKDEIIETKQEGRVVTISGKRHGLRTGMKVLIGGTDRVARGFYEVFVISDTEFFYQVPENQSADVDKEQDEDVVYAYDSTIYYVFIFKQSDGFFKENIFYQATGHTTNKKFVAGLHLPRFILSKGKELSNFFGSRQRLAFYISGSEDLSSTFDGKIYRVGFSSARNLSKIDHLFNEEGIPVDYQDVFNNFGSDVLDAGKEYFGNDSESWKLALDGGDPYDFQATTAINHIASYTLLPKKEMGMFSLDFGVNAYWEDYVPLSYFAKETTNAFGKKEMSISFLQINLDYPKLEIFDKLDNYETSKNHVRAYVSFQYLKNGSNMVEKDFLRKEKIKKGAVVVPGNNWMNTKYEIVDGTILYPPPNIDFRNISLSLYLEYSIDGANTNPVSIKSFQISSQSLGHSPNKIGTKFGTDIIPYSQYGQYFNYNLINPFAIYKGSTPYLYNTSNSGIEIRGQYDNSVNSGMSIPINKNLSPFLKVAALQIFLKYGEELFPEVPIKIFEIQSKNFLIKFFLIADSKNKKRGQIYAIDDRTKRIQTQIDLVANGKIVARPVMYSKQWLAFGMSFPDFLDFGEVVGALRITSPIMFNNFSFYQTSLRDDERRSGLRPWFNVSSSLGEAFDWSYWSGLETVGTGVAPTGNQVFTWEQVKFFELLELTDTNAQDIYKIYTGTQRNIISSDKTFSIGGYHYKNYSGLAWSQNTVKPA